jgi:integrase
MQRDERMTRHNFAGYEGHVFNYVCPDPERHTRSRRFHKRGFFTGGIGNLKLAHLSARAVGDFRDRLRDFGLSVATTRQVLGTLKLVLGYAISRDLLAVNVARGVKVIGRRDEAARKIVPPTKAALKQLIAVAPPDFRVKLLVAAMTGMRAGEFHALRWKHLDFDKAEMRIETRVDAYRQEDVTKTAAGMRTIPLGAEVVAELKAWRARTRRPRDHDLVFPNRRGWYENHDNMVKRDFRPLFAKLALLHESDPAQHAPSPKIFNWHALRHFAISCWIDAGLAPKTVQTFAGHSTLAVTMDRYGHLFKSDDHKLAMNQIAREFVPSEPCRADVSDPKPARKLKEFIP